MMCIFRLHKRELKIENTSLAQFAFHRNFPIVTVRDGFDDGESQPGAALHQRFTVRIPKEFFEQTWQIPLWNTHTPLD